MTVMTFMICKQGNTVKYLCKEQMLQGSYCEQGEAVSSSKWCPQMILGDRAAHLFYSDELLRADTCNP